MSEHLVTKVKTLNVDGIEVFYREAGRQNAPVLLLLHGFPTSSFQYRKLIPRLANKYRVLVSSFSSHYGVCIVSAVYRVGQAPDYPAFGFTKVPQGNISSDDSKTEFKYTFESLTKVIIDFTDALNLTKFGMYIFDYGAPIGLRLALERPDAITVIVSQNGNAFVEGLGAFWDPIRAYWNNPTLSNRDALRKVLTFEGIKSKYTTGEEDPDSIPPETYYLDHALVDRPGNADIQLDLLYDYRTNVALYPTFQEYFKKHQPPLIAIWGKNDPSFVPPGAEAFKTVLPRAEVYFVNGGHIVLENHLEEVLEKMLDFLGRIGY